MICVRLLAFCLLMALAGTVSADQIPEGDIQLKFQAKGLSADLKDTPLKSILMAIQKQKGIWFKAEDDLLEEKISIQFRDLSMEGGMRRILASMNHLLVFGQGGELNAPSQTESGPNLPANKRGTTSPTPPGEPVTTPQGTPESLKVKASPSPPGGTVKTSEEAKKAFQVRKNVPAPGTAQQEVQP